MRDSEDSTEFAIRVRDVSKSFTVHNDQRSTLKERFVRGRSRHKNTFRALDHVSFDVRKGTTFGLIGHNGSGKSTMLKILAGVYRPTSGEVSVSGKVDALLELGAGFHGELTGRENIYLNGAILGRSHKEIEESLDWIIDYADIGNFIDEPVKVYSSGMTVRLGFAVAVAIHPKILIVDEIIAVGDEEFQRKCFDLMRDLRRSGTTIVLVTHSLSLAQDMCDEVVWLDHGRVRSVGDADEVVSAYLAHVNALERSKRSAELGSADLPEEGDSSENRGTGECRMTQVEYLDEQRRAVPFLTSGQDGTIRVHILARRPLENVELGLAFTTDDGTTVAGPNSRHADRLYSLPMGSSYVDYTMRPVRLLPAHFLLTTALLDSQGRTFDYSDRRTDLLVRGDKVVDEPGLVQLPLGEWSDSPTPIQMEQE
ncbi:ABC transporter ATP-binding protein [Actinomyces provencensis]|uniref:ABC transporter ATP-binding protein n=1 Tax=Actinomyces provencensis TaxID=1720198 RepID=UPI00096A4E83|nr:ABC transporter ATP-binding protein [Actinomyces provencensis]